MPGPIHEANGHCEAAEQRDAADEGRVQASGSITVGTVIVQEGEVVRPSQLIRECSADPGWEGSA